MYLFFSSERVLSLFLFVAWKNKQPIDHCAVEGALTTYLVQIINVHVMLQDYIGKAACSHSPIKRVISQRRTFSIVNINLTQKLPAGSFNHGPLYKSYVSHNVIYNCHNVNAMLKNFYFFCIYISLWYIIHNIIPLNFLYIKIKMKYTRGKRKKKHVYLKK